MTTPKQKLITSLETHSGNPCISILLPLEKSYPENQQNPIRYKNAVKKVKSILDKMLEPEAVETMINLLHAAEKQIDYINTREGIAVYVSPGMQEIVEISIEVEETIEVRDYFLVQPLKKDLASRKKYVVLALSKGKTRLFNGVNDRLSEVSNEHFPLPFENEYQDIKTDYRFKKEESSVNSKRLEGFLRDVNHHLEKHLGQKQIPLVLLGVEKHLSTYEKVTHNHHPILDRIPGNYDHQSESEIADIVWPRIQHLT